MFQLSHEIAVLIHNGEDEDLDVRGQVVGGIQIRLEDLAVQPDQDLVSHQKQACSKRPSPRNPGKPGVPVHRRSNQKPENHT